MWLLLSGEGRTDMGEIDYNNQEFKAGPMAIIVDQIVEAKLGYSHIDWNLTELVTEAQLLERQKQNKKPGRLGRFRRHDEDRETRFYYDNARALATFAKELAKKENDEVIAVLFRDCDDAQSAGRGLMKAKVESMLNGFTDENFPTGVPMMPMPKSEAWLLCAVKTNPYQNCAALEQESGNDHAPNPLKDQLAAAVNAARSAADWADAVRSRAIDIDRIDMPSFNTFRQRLEEVTAYSSSKSS